MRQPARVPHVLHVLRYLALLGVLCFAARAHADDRAEARAHYQAGVKAYSGGDYQAAIREFSAAQQLAPADLNNYNLALCYDKLGDAEPAIQYYRAFLDKQPNSDKRAEVEASINRLEAASRSAASKKAEEARRAEDARKADEARRAKADEAARPTAPVLGPASPPPAGPPSGPAAGPAPGPGAPPAAGPVIGPAPAPSAAPDERKRPGPGVAAPTGGQVGGSVGTPSTATPVPTGDSQLDRVNAINIDEVRDQRAGAGGVPAERRGGPAVAANDVPPPQGPGQAPLAPNSVPGGSDHPKETPVYKKWWFWAVVAVSGYVVYSLATSDSSPQTRARVLPMSNASPQPGGLTLMRW